MFEIAFEAKNKTEDIFIMSKLKLVDMDTMRDLSRSKDLTNRFLSKN